MTINLIYSLGIPILILSKWLLDWKMMVLFFGGFKAMTKIAIVMVHTTMINLYTPLLARPSQGVTILLYCN